MSTKPLTRINPSGLYWIDAAGTKHKGDCSGLSGNCSGLSGDCSGLSGNCSGLWGNCSGLSGNCSGLWGDCSGIPLSARPCGLTDWIEKP